MSWYMLKECFPPTKEKKAQYRNDRIVQRLIKSNPTIQEDEFLGILDNTQKPIFQSVMQSQIDKDRIFQQSRSPFMKRMAKWYDHTSTRLSNQLFLLITRKWDNGEHTQLSETEKAALLMEYGYSAKPPSQP